MEKITKDHELAASQNPVTTNISKLRELFPSIVSEDKIDFEALRQLLGDEITEDEEYFRFVWPGKKQARAEALKPSTGTLRPAPQESLDWETTQNVYIEGDNLEVLKLLQRSYAGKVKMIYIDPPYNTGKDFVYKDNYRDNLASYRENYGRKDEDGNTVVTQSERNSESSGRYHSNWLNMMYPRLQLARNLLREDGVIFISIDDVEVDNLSKVLNEIFGESNFIGNVMWQKSYSPSNDKKGIHAMHDNILVYQRGVDGIGLFPRTKKQNKAYNNLDDDPRGPWKSVDATRAEHRDYAFYPITTPSGKIVYPAKGRSWVFNKEELPVLLSDNRLWFGQSGDAKPSKKLFLTEVKQGVTPTTWWDHSFAGHNDQSKKEIKSLFPEGVTFPTPKPTKLIKRILQLASKSSSESIILDFFSGSATTAHAILNLNKEDGGNRKYIMVQLPEPIDEKSEAHKAGYPTIAEIGKERIRRVVKKIKEDASTTLSGREEIKAMDLGFRVFKLDSSNIEAWDPDPEALEDNLFSDNIKPDRTEHDLVYEILLKYGLDLSLPITKRPGPDPSTGSGAAARHTLYSVGGGALFLCLGAGITRRAGEAILAWAEEIGAVNPKVVFRDTGFTSSVEKTNAYEVLRSGGVTDVKSV
jgi:adenine-specific DNA-methyltransferase